eukprot:scaffold12533_cov65-Cyclotella_meneghiniana.AAC.13
MADYFSGYEYTAQDNEEPVCEIYSSDDAFTIFVQVLLALIALIALWIKRMNETPRREFVTWFLDVSKQAFGACYAHVLNMIISALIADNVGSSMLNDQCAWYAINYVIDTTLGLVITIFLLNALEKVANQRNWTSLKDSGVYIGREGMIHWIMQMLAWVVILTIVKILVCIFMWITATPLAYIGQILFEPLQSNIRFELLFVMIFFPGILNIIYFWITDSYLKSNKHEKDGTTTNAANAEKELSPVPQLGESVTPYSQMGTTTGDDLNGRQSGTLV